MDSIIPIPVEYGLVECDSNSNRKKRSVAWDHFEKIPGENKEEGKAKCKHCDMVLSATPKSGTSHLRRHVERCPKRLVLDIRPISMESGASDFEISIDCGVHRRRTSKVWDEFEKFQSGNSEEQKAMCKHCNTVLSAAAKNGTSHLKRHLEKCPRRVTVGGEVNRGIPYYFAEKNKTECASSENYEPGPNELVRCTLLCIMDGPYSFSLVEKRGFRQMMSKACPQYIPFSRSVMKRELLSIYMKERDKVKESLIKAPGMISLATETLKASDTESKYICVSANFIDEQWKLHRRVLCIRPLVPAFDGISVADEVAYLLSQWNVGHKTLSITMDYSCYNESIASSLERGLFTRKVLLGGSTFQVRCYGHILNFIAESILKLVSDNLDKIRDLVNHVNRSPVQRKKFYALAEKKFQLLPRKTVRVDIPSRWNSTYKLIDRALFYKSVFEHLVEQDHQLGDEEWHRLSVVHRFLKILYDVTCMVAVSKYPTANIYLKGLLMVHRRLLEVSRGPHTFMSDTIREMEVKFDDYWSENSLVLSCAAILDPRYKVKFLEYCYMKLSGDENVSERVSRVVNTLYCLLAEYKQQHAFSSTSIGSSGVSTNFPCSGDDGDVFGDYNQFLSMSSKPRGSKSELDQYLEEPSFDLNYDLEVLEFWSKSSMRYPELSILARDLLSVPVSSSTLKFSFCIGGKRTSAIHSSSLPETTQALVCLQDWLRPQEESDDPTIKGEDDDDSSEDDGYDDEDDGSVLTDSF